MNSTNMSNSLNAMSRLIIQTKYGGVPFLNDYFISLFNANFFNVKFSELINYLDIFEKYDKHLNEADNTNSLEPKLTHSDTRLLSQFLKLDYTYLSFLDINDVTKSSGTNNDSTYLLHTNTGKVKVTSQEYIRYLNILNPELAEIPYEFLPEDCGKNRVTRSYRKMTEFFVQFNESKLKVNHNVRLIVPVFMYHLDNLSQSEFIQLINKNKNFINGFLIITENYKKLNLEKILKYKSFIQTQLVGEALINFDNGHPIDMMLSHEIGSRFFEMSFPFDLSEKGKCVESNFFENYEKSLMSSNKDTITFDNFKDINFAHYDLRYIDLNDKEFETDIRVIKENCACFTCKSNYTRAYIHHLLKCHELNANILLILHNLHFIQRLHQSYAEIKSESYRLGYLLKFLNEECQKIE